MHVDCQYDGSVIANHEQVAGFQRGPPRLAGVVAYKHSNQGGSVVQRHPDRTYRHIDKHEKKKHNHKNLKIANLLMNEDTFATNAGLARNIITYRHQAMAVCLVAGGGYTSLPGCWW